MVLHWQMISLGADYKRIQLAAMGPLYHQAQYSGRDKGYIYVQHCIN